ncbi:hypothetical protein HPB47_021138 [Ixodes persulcatus]|uniref:Uncharacterized protein n=1 Tax=Ixodes persulcatus TaxID=34615 RepID=A0AC60QDF5_IXOPE|nr:hypothetical protein HPB47_021138 [Ixodes persulcatus]
MQIPRAVFRASRGWVERMMKRNGFSLGRRTTICQKLPLARNDSFPRLEETTGGSSSATARAPAPGHTPDPDPGEIEFQGPGERVDKEAEPEQGSKRSLSSFTVGGSFGSRELGTQRHQRHSRVLFAGTSTTNPQDGDIQQHDTPASAKSSDATSGPVLTYGQHGTMNAATQEAFHLLHPPQASSPSPYLLELQRTIVRDVFQAPEYRTRREQGTSPTSSGGDWGDSNEDAVDVTVGDVFRSRTQDVI